ncbi:MAG: twin-arginine translocation signal domain-containing protein [Nanoarchaeota archaeon]|nr:twin-arginine translocation signal domain-containing protein [Nanoarchaeota archaeon]
MALTDMINEQENSVISRDGSNIINRRGFLQVFSTAVAAVAAASYTLSQVSSTYACPAKKPEKKQQPEKPERKYTSEDFINLLIKQKKIKNTEPDKRYLKSLWDTTDDDYKPRMYDSQADPLGFYRKMDKKEREILKEFSSKSADWGEGVYENYRAFFPWISKKPEGLTLDQKLLIHLDIKESEEYLEKVRKGDF